MWIKPRSKPLLSNKKGQHFPMLYALKLMTRDPTTKKQEPLRWVTGHQAEQEPFRWKAEHQAKQTSATPHPLFDRNRQRSIPNQDPLRDRNRNKRRSLPHWDPLRDGWRPSIPLRDPLRNVDWCCGCRWLRSGTNASGVDQAMGRRQCGLKCWGQRLWRLLHWRLDLWRHWFKLWCRLWCSLCLKRRLWHRLGLWLSWSPWLRLCQGGGRELLEASPPSGMIHSGVGYKGWSPSNSLCVDGTGRTLLTQTWSNTELCIKSGEILKAQMSVQSLFHCGCFFP